MGGCYGNNFYDRSMERQLFHYLDSIAEFECENCVNFKFANEKKTPTGFVEVCRPCELNDYGHFKAREDDKNCVDLWDDYVNAIAQADKENEKENKTGKGEIMKKYLTFENVVFVLAMVVVVGLLVFFTSGCKQALKPEALASAAQVMQTQAIVAPATAAYTVKKGDCLWNISKKPAIYNDAFQWLLLYRSNRDEIADPNIIEINQELKVGSYSPFEKIDAAKEAMAVLPYKKIKKNK